jgi:hypothetical protein
MAGEGPMTDFETVYLFNDSTNMMFTLAANFSTLIFAFVVASAMGAQRLSRSMVVFALSAYGVIAVSMILHNSRLMVTWRNLALQIREMAGDQNSNVPWHVLKSSPEALLTLVPHLVNVSYVLVFIGSLYFFRECRRGNFRI